MSDSQPTDTPAASAPSADPVSPTSADQAPPADTASKTARLSMIVLALIAVGHYLHVLNYELVYDDHFVLNRNASMEAVGRDFSSVLDLYGQEYWEGVNPDSPEMLKVKGQALYRPLTMSLWSIVYSFHGSATTWGYHLLSILANAFVVIVLYRLVTYLFDSQRLAFVSALIFALHPLHSEAVTYVAGLHDVLSAGAVLLGLLLFAKGRTAGGTLSTGAYVGILATLFVGLLAKEQTILLLPAIMLTDGLFAAQGRGLRASQRVLLYAGLLVVIAGHVAIRYEAIGYLRPQGQAISILDNPLINEDFGIRLMNGIKLIAKSAWLFLWPARLASDYSYNAIPVSISWFAPGVLAGTVLVGTLLMIGLAWIKRWASLCWGLLFFLGCTAFFANIITPIGTIFAERLTYLPTAGACVAAAALIERFILSRGTREGGAMHPLALLALVVLTAALAIRTVDRNADFRTSLSLFEAAEEVSPDSARVHFQLGGLEAKAELFTKAERSMQQSLSILPTFLLAKVALGDIYMSDKNYDMALDQYREVLSDLRYTPSEGPVIADTRRLALQKIATIQLERGDLEGAEQQLRLLIESTPTDPRGYLDMARMLNDQDRPADALPYLHDLLDHVPGNVEGMRLMARASGRVGDREAYVRAVDALEQSEDGRAYALCLTAESLYNAARAEHDDEKLREALAKFDEARQLDDSLVLPYTYRARYLLEIKRPFDALTQIEAALQRNPRNPGALFTKTLVLFNLNTHEAHLESIETLSMLETINPNRGCYELMVEAYFRLGRRSKMEQALRRLEELGAVPVQVVVQRAFAYEDEDDIDTAISFILEALELEGYEQDPRLLRELGRLFLRAGRYAEALAAFNNQSDAEAERPDSSDPFLPINRARAFMGLGRHVEAARQLELFEQSTNPDNPMERASLLHRRAELFLVHGGAFYRPAEAVELCREGLNITGYRHTPFFDLLIEALLDQGDIEGALSQVNEARVQFPNAERYRVTELALLKARRGDVELAATMLREADDKLLERLANALQR